MTGSLYLFSWCPCMWRNLLHLTHPSLSQIKHELDATLCRFYFCRVTLHVSGASAHHQEYLKLVQRPLVRVLSLQVSHHITTVSALIRWCDALPATITHVPVAAVPVLNTPDDGRLCPKHVEWLCRNKTCTVLHQVGVLFDLYYDARKHKIKTPNFIDAADKIVYYT